MLMVLRSLPTFLRNESNEAWRRNGGGRDRRATRDFIGDGKRRQGFRLDWEETPGAFLAVHKLFLFPDGGDGRGIVNISFVGVGKRAVFLTLVIENHEL